MDKTVYVPQYFILEAMGFFSLKGSDEAQLQTAEEIGGMNFHSMDQFVDTIKPYVKPSTFNKELKELKDNDFFKAHWKVK